MQRLLRWLGELSISGAVLLLGRYLMRVSSPQRDMYGARRWWWRLEARWREHRATLLRAYGPITDDMRAAWEQLRTSYQKGNYGAQGT